MRDRFNFTNVNDVDAALIEDLLKKNQPLRIETASGRIFDVPHRDFIAFSPKRTALSIFYEENGEDHIAIVPLLTVTVAIVRDLSAGNGST